MASSSRDLHIRREKGQALVRALHLSELQAAGAARSAALAEADTQLDRIARLLKDALGSGISLAEVARVTNVSRPTLYELRARYSKDQRDLRLAVVQTIAGGGPIDRAGVAEHLEIPRAEVEAIVSKLMDDGMVDEDVNAEGPAPMMELYLTDHAFDWLETWDFDEAADETEGGATDE